MIVLLRGFTLIGQHATGLSDIASVSECQLASDSFSINMSWQQTMFVLKCSHFKPATQIAKKDQDMPVQQSILAIP